MAQWIAHLTSDQKVAGSSPVWVALSVLFCKYFDFKSNFVALISTRGQEPCHRLLLYQQWSLNIILFHLLKQQNYRYHLWPSGTMDSASDFGSEGCRFKQHYATPSTLLEIYSSLRQVIISLNPKWRYRRSLHRSGIEPVPPAWKASILPLNQRCLHVMIRFEAMLDPHLHWNGWFTHPKTKLSVSHKLWFYKTACVDRESNPEQQLGRLLC